MKPGNIITPAKSGDKRHGFIIFFEKNLEKLNQSQNKILKKLELYMKNNKKFEFFGKKLITRFNDKIQNYSFYDPKVVGWDTKKNQHLRFSRALKFLNFKNKKVLDVGCGRVIFYIFAKRKNNF